MHLHGDRYRIRHFPKCTAGTLRENINKPEANKPLKLLTGLRISYNKLFVNYITFFIQKVSKIMIDIL